MTRKTLLALLALAVSTLSWSSIPLFLKYFTAYLDAWTVNGVRYGLAALLLLPALRHRRNRQTPVAPLWKAALVPALINTVGQVGWALIPYFVTASVMGFGIRASFFFTLAGSLLLLPEERYLFRSRAFWCGSAVCISGVTGLFWGSLRQSMASPSGLLLLLLASGVWGFYGVSVRRFMRGHAPHRAFAAISLYTAILVCILMLGFGRFAALGTLSPGLFSMLFISAILGITVAHVLMIYVLNHLGAVVEAGGEMVTPFLTFCGASIIFGERLSPLQWAGGLGVVLGCALMILAHKPKPELAVSTDALGID